MDGLKSRVLLSDIVKQLRRENANVPDIYFTLLDASDISPILVLNHNAAAKERGSCVTFNFWLSEAAKAVDTGGTAYGSLLNLVKASKMPVSKVRPFLQSRPSFTKFTLATRKIKRMKAFDRFKIEIWFVYADKPAKNINCVQYLLVRQDVFDRTVDAKRMKTKDFNKEAHAFLNTITKINWPQKIWVEKSTEIAGEFEKLCEVEVIQTYSTMRETTAAFAQRTIRSLKKHFTVTWKIMVKSTSEID